MKRLHVHVAVDDIAESVRFYSVLFAADPAVLKSDYAKWMLDDPRVNFAISRRGAGTGVRHLGIQVETPEELREVYGRLQQAARVLEEGLTTCCYAKSEKSWIADPQGVAWETFLTSGESAFYGEHPDLPTLAALERREADCCTPETRQGECCPPKAGLAPDAPCCATIAATERA
jgi:catechol 2,3-dioxygenase-like lactoylglutathione lyase family enzyme